MSLTEQKLNRDLVKPIPDVNGSNHALFKIIVIRVDWSIALGLITTNG